MQITREIRFSARLIGLACFILGIVAVLAIRFAIYQPPAKIHYHANFAVYINGQRELFKGPAYYAETKLCQAASVETPIERAHLHNNVNSVVHVHDHAVTWGQLFANLNWTLGPDLLEAPDGPVYATNGTAKLHVLLNGQDVTDFSNIANTVIKDQARLLLSYGDETGNVLQQQYQTVPSTAKQYDESTDPSSCGGAEGVSLSDRLHHLF